MVCPNCGMEMKHDFCIHCGYMTNGNFIDTDKIIDDSLLELYLGKDYDKITRNQNWIVAGILGPIYIFSRSHYLFGLLLIAVDILISLFFFVFSHAFLIYYVVVMFNVFYVVFNRIVWATIGNLIYKKLMLKRLEKIKREYPNDYKKRITKMYENDTKLLVIKYVLGFLLFLAIFSYLKGLIYNTLGLI